ncbi:hypothetical protein GEW_03962 [Pasteurella multocida subsp. gallicida str. Anand1_poultry]|nr:hypothetical protein GEW_03962 [Pasteurella multocida subsp. gallicida str. Anand1_poultry]
MDNRDMAVKALIGSGNYFNPAISGLTALMVQR